MAVRLSEGAVKDILTKPSEQHPQKPILQILGLKKIQSSKDSGSDRYRLVLSDGINLHTSAMLGTQLNDKVVNKELEVKTVVQLNKYICNVVQEVRKVLIVLDIAVIKRASEVAGKIGDPKSLSDAGAEKPQKNGGPTAQQNEGGQQGAQQQVPIRQQPPLSRGGGLTGGPSISGRLASATYGSNQPLAHHADTSRAVYPISSLTPYQNRWTIRARVTSKSNIKTWSNSRGEGKLFNIELVDESGEIRVTGFNDAVDKFYDMLEVNKAYYLSRASVKTANKKYSSIRNDYEISLNNDTVIEPCPDASDLPGTQYSFVSISDLENIEKDGVVDVLGVAVNISDVTEVTTRATNKQVSKRNVMLVDRSGKSVSLTLWGEQAETFGEYIGKNPVLALKGAKVSDFGGRSLSVLMSTNMSVNPTDLPEAHTLKGWYENVGKDNAIQSISGQRSEGGMGNAEFKTLSQVKTEQLGTGEKVLLRTGSLVLPCGHLDFESTPDYFLAKGTIVYFKKENCLYKACPSPDCNKKVIEDNDSYRCEKCNKSYPDFKYRLILQINLADFTGNQWLTCFQESAEAILNSNAEKIGQLKDSNDEQTFDQIFSEATFKSFIFKLRAKMETYNDETRLKCSAVNVQPVAFNQESLRLIGEIKKLKAM